MRKFQICIILLFVASIGLFGFTRVKLKMTTQNQSPVIALQEGEAEVLSISTSAEETDLLQGITATDPEDGDLTDEVMVERISPLTDDHTCEVTYAVFDSQGKSGAFTRTVKYSDYVSPKINLKEPLVCYIGRTAKILGNITATDCVDGDITGKIQVLTSTIDTSIEGTYSVTVQVKNSLGDSTTLTLPVVEQRLSYSAPTITLTKALVYLKQGEEFDPKTYIASVVDSNENALDVNSVEIYSDVDTQIPGTYTVTYITGETNQTYTVCLAVVVE